MCALRTFGPPKRCSAQEAVFRPELHDLVCLGMSDSSLPERGSSTAELTKETGCQMHLAVKKERSLLDMLAAVARKDYEDRRRRQNQGIKKARSEGKYQGRQPDLKRRQHIASLLRTGHSYSEIQDILGCSRHLIASVAKEQKQSDAA